MKRYILSFIVLSLGKMTVADPLVCSNGMNSWGENIRTGKFASRVLREAQSVSYLYFLKSLSPLNDECVEKPNSHLEFGPIQTNSSLGENGIYWATYAVNVGCCIQADGG